MPWEYITKRIAQAIFVVVGVSIGVFLLLHLSGDPVALLMPPGATAQDAEILRKSFALDQALVTQYVRFVARALRGDLGNSFRHTTPTLPLVLERLPATFSLTAAAITLACLIAIPTGVLSASQRHRALDRILIFFSLFGVSMPTFWFGLVLILVFAEYLHVLPAFGGQDWSALVLPTVTLATYSVGRLARMTRSTALGVISEEYVRTARAKGVSEFTVLFRHVLPNAALPTVTLAGLEFGVLLGGAVITETVFAYPGVGLLMIQSIYNRDFPVVRCAVLVIALLFVTLNLLTDMLYLYLNPRISFGKS